MCLKLSCSTMKGRGRQAVSSQGHSPSWQSWDCNPGAPPAPGVTTGRCSSGNLCRFSLELGQVPEVSGQPACPHALHRLCLPPGQGDPSPSPACRSHSCVLTPLRPARVSCRAETVGMTLSHMPPFLLLSLLSRQPPASCSASLFSFFLHISGSL